ncbi:nitrogenase-associated protein [Calothrix sp. NIES-4101]|nr:nitrogenase-associated protein [Calothrix sp. NIES-4101]
MAKVIFYEKPGCKNNTKQKTLLVAAGHELETYDIRTYAWTPDTLRLFFGTRPITDWFNKAAPSIKSGEVVPEKVDPDTALKLMIQDPLLIRRPLIQVDDRREVGFDIDRIDAWIGLKPIDASQQAISEELMRQDLQGCAHGNEHHHEPGKCKH